MKACVAAAIAWQLGRLAARDPRAAMPMTAALLVSSIGMVVLGRRCPSV
jgi:hypothetical protein